MTRSMSTTSGWWLAAASRAAGPLAASATTSMSGWSWRKARRPWRTTAWSSTRRTRILALGALATGRRPVGNRRRHGRAGARGRLHRELPPYRRGPLTHRCQAHRAGRPRESPGIEAGTLVTHRQPDLAALLLEADVHPGAGCVAERVVERLLPDPEQSQLDARGEAGPATANANLDGGAVGPLQGVHVVPKRSLQAVPLQALRTQRVDQGPHLLEGRGGAPLEP